VSFCDLIWCIRECGSPRVNMRLANRFKGAD
jgi:hypothetical protein